MTPPRLITLSEGRSSHIYLELFPCAVPILPICGSGIAVGLLPVSVSILAAVAAATLGDLAFTHQSVGYSISIRILPSKPTPVVPFLKASPTSLVQNQAGQNPMVHHHFTHEKLQYQLQDRTPNSFHKPKGFSTQRIFRPTRFYVLHLS